MFFYRGSDTAIPNPSIFLVVLRTAPKPPSNHPPPPATASRHAFLTCGRPGRPVRAGTSPGGPR
jgi:hypothetical protein